MAETNKILGLKTGEEIPVDGQCVRIGALRCHSQAIILKLRGPIALSEIEAAITNHNEWVDFVPNTKVDSLAKLTPAAVSGSLRIAIGRLRTLAMGPEYITCFTVGDQLLWGAAEPVRRALRMVVKCMVE